MENTLYLNGSYVSSDVARISPFDRGFLMSDGIYEVTSVIDGRLIDYDGHVARLRRSVAELDMVLPCGPEDLLAIHREILGRNGITEGGIYLQLTRGAPSSRDFLWPDPATVPPTLLVFGFQKSLVDTAAARNGIRVKTIPDLRWQRRDIKTIQLLYASQAKSLAHAEGFDDVWMTEGNFVTEASSSNSFIVLNDRIVTRPLSTKILHGVTRSALLRYATISGVEVVERDFTVAEAYEADEAFSTSSTTLVQPVVSIDNKLIGNGLPGEVSKALRTVYHEECLRHGS